MKWGLITDTHDKLGLARAAAGVFESTGCGQVFHGGDFNSDDIADVFTGRQFAFHYVTDHNSHDRGMKKYRAEALDKRVDGNRVFMFHDTYPCQRAGRADKARVVDEAIARRRHDFVFYGHLHYFNLKLPSPANETIAVNAGGLYHETLSTCCVLDLEEPSLDLYYWTQGAFAPVLRFHLLKDLASARILDETRARAFFSALRDLRWGHSDRMEHVLSDGEDPWWFARNYGPFFERLGIADRPAFFSRGQGIDAL